MTRKGRGNISISAATYARLKAHCDGIAMSQFVEAVVDELPRVEPAQ